MQPEQTIQNAIRIALSPYCILFRTNAGKAWQGKVVYSNEFKQNVLINMRPIELLPEGHSDLAGVQKSSGRAVYIECKTLKGTARDKQEHFICTMRESGALAGIARSVEDALHIIEVEP